MESREQCGRFVAGWKQYPLIEIVASGNFQEIFDLRFVVCAGPRQSPAGVAGETCQPDVGRGHHPHWHAVSPKAPGDGKTVEVSAEDQCACGVIHEWNILRGAKRRLTQNCFVSVMRTGKFQLSDERLAYTHTIAHRFACDEAHQRAGRVMGANNKLHQRTKTPDGRRAENM